MIKIVKKSNTITISGHANSAEYGKDIVCASVSSIIYTTINALKKIQEESIEVEDKGSMIIKVLTDDEIVKTLIENMMELLKSIEEDYPKNLSVKES
ncbi:MAG: ribosomal-processing cysteine protease Prp [Firmicutes bacterium]|nr:ribosomal-processing cysteine protease Prp [Bacillota bacterium]